MLTTQSVSGSPTHLPPTPFCALPYRAILARSVYGPVAAHFSLPTVAPQFRTRLRHALPRTVHALLHDVPAPSFRALSLIHI